MKISIVALGKVGTELFNKLYTNNTEVFGSYFNNPKKISNEFYFDFFSCEYPDQLKNCDIIVFNLTPSLIKEFLNFKNFVENVTFKKIIFISSTSIYGNQGLVDESTMAIPDCSSGRLLNECEEYLQNSNFDFTIIRPAGIYSTKNHPGYYLSGKSFKIGKDEKINLISRDELVDIIIKSFDSSHKIINAVNSNHPNKEDYYKNFCMKNNIEVPQFLISNEIKNKIVSTQFEEFTIKSELP